MNPFYKISIPKPCHEDWDKMTPKDKGRFCDSCSKTVIDFTKMKDFEIHDFISQNRSQKMCGHFKQDQLDSINLFIPIETFTTKNFHKLFLLVLLITMGTSLLSCTNIQGDNQKIDSVEVVKTLNDTITNKQIELKTTNFKVDTITKNVNPIFRPPPKPIITGEIVEVVGIMVAERKANDPYSVYQVEKIAEFKNTPKNLSKEEKRGYFQTKISEIIDENFNTKIASENNLKGLQKIYVQFVIDSVGEVKKIKVRASHYKLEEEAKRVIKLFPQFIPAENNGEKITMVYTLPIIFQVED